MGIKYLEHNEINKAKWDETISVSFNGNIYGFSWYLDIVCSGWSALVENDYDRVMPLPVCKKLGMCIVYTPELIENLGVFSATKLNEKIVLAFVKAIPSKFGYAKLRLNKYCKLHASDYNLTSIQKKKIDLIADYETIKQNTNKRLLQKVDDIMQQGFIFSELVKPLECFKFVQDVSLPFVSRKSVKSLESIIYETYKKKVSSIWGIYNPQGNLCTVALIYNKLHNSIAPSNNSIVFFVKSDGRYAGEDMEEALIYNYIKKNCSTSSTLEINKFNKNSEIFLSRNFVSDDSVYVELVKENTAIVKKYLIRLLFKNYIKQ